MMSDNTTNNYCTAFISLDHLYMEQSEKDKLIQEMNELSSDFTKNKERMMEIAKILLAEHYGFTRKPKKESDLESNDTNG
jgi:hypothetical protein